MTLSHSCFLASSQTVALFPSFLSAPRALPYLNLFSRGARGRRRLSVIPMTNATKDESDMEHEQALSEIVIFRNKASNSDVSLQ